jgi:hypothetical protein
MVDLGDEADEAAHEPLDDPQLPERTIPGEGDAGYARDELVELLAAAGREHRRAVHMAVEIEVGIFDPHGW